MCFKETEPVSVKFESPLGNQQTILETLYEEILITFVTSLNEFQTILVHFYFMHLQDHDLRQLIMNFLNIDQKIMFLTITLWLMGGS